MQDALEIPAGKYCVDRTTLRLTLNNVHLNLSKLNSVLCSYMVQVVTLTCQYNKNLISKSINLA